MYIWDESTLEMELSLNGPSVTLDFERPETDLAQRFKIPHICGPVQYLVIK